MNKGDGDSTCAWTRRPYVKAVVQALSLTAAISAVVFLTEFFLLVSDYIVWTRLSPRGSKFPDRTWPGKIGELCFCAYASFWSGAALLSKRTLARVAGWCVVLLGNLCFAAVCFAKWYIQNS